MSIKVLKLIRSLQEEAKKPETVGRIGLLFEEAARVIQTQLDDLEALRQQGSDHG